MHTYAREELVSSIIYLCRGCIRPFADARRQRLETCNRTTKAETIPVGVNTPDT